jgi:nitroreductase
MTNAIIESIVSRSTTKYYDPAVTLSDDQIRELVRIGTTAPTSFQELAPSGGRCAGIR